MAGSTDIADRGADAGEGDAARGSGLGVFDENAEAQRRAARDGADDRGTFPDEARDAHLRTLLTRLITRRRNASMRSIAAGSTVLFAVVKLDADIEEVTVENPTAQTVDVFLGEDKSNGGMPMFSVGPGTFKRVPMPTPIPAAVVAVLRAADAGYVRVWTSNTAHGYATGGITI